MLCLWKLQVLKNQISISKSWGAFSSEKVPNSSLRSKTLSNIFPLLSQHTLQKYGRLLYSELISATSWNYWWFNAWYKINLTFTTTFINSANLPDFAHRASSWITMELKDEMLTTSFWHTFPKGTQIQVLSQLFL